MKTCKKCGANTPDEGIFCMMCGHKLGTVANNKTSHSFKTNCFNIIKDISRYFAILSCILLLYSLSALFNYQVSITNNEETYSVFFKEKIAAYYSTSIMYDSPVALSIAKKRYKSNVIQGCEFYGSIFVFSLLLFYWTNKQLTKRLFDVRCTSIS